ncbi:MAG: PAQR family membrane homeostasis protein TrhA [Thermodesulfobacteriota bacterium]
MDDLTPRYSVREEIANSITHGIGFLLSIVGLCLLIVLSRAHGDAWHVVSCIIYGSTLIFLYAASTLYHSIYPAKLKPILRTLDHSTIFLLIAGTYTPFTLVNLRGPWGWSLFAVIWILAFFGIIFQKTMLRKGPMVSVGFYLLMGWVVVAAVKPMLSRVAPGGWVLLLLGGLSYTIGVVFYSWKRMPYNHAVWHLFVLAGSACHFFAVLFYVIPRTPASAI